MLLAWLHVHEARRKGCRVGSLPPSRRAYACESSADGAQTTRTACECTSAVGKHTAHVHIQAGVERDNNHVAS